MTERELTVVFVNDTSVTQTWTIDASNGQTKTVKHDGLIWLPAK